MDAHIKSFQVLQQCGAVWMLVLAVIPASAVAGQLPDPTRPPLEIITASGAGGQTGEQAPTAVENKGLSSVIIAPDRRAAIIDGHTVELGAKYGDFTLIEVKEGAVILRDAKGRQVILTLFSGAGIRKKETQPRQQQDKIGTTTTGKQHVNETSPQVVPREAK